MTQDPILSMTTRGGNLAMVVAGTLNCVLGPNYIYIYIDRPSTLTLSGGFVQEYYMPT